MNAKHRRHHHRAADVRSRPQELGRHALAGHAELRDHPPDPRGLSGDNGGTFAFGRPRELQSGAPAKQRATTTSSCSAPTSPASCSGGHLDEIWLHISPILLGGGTPMFDGDTAKLVPLEKPRVGNATHHFFRVAN